MKRMPSLYCESVAKFPWAFLLLYAIIVIVAIAAGWRKIEVNTDVKAFREIIGNASLAERSYREALKHQQAVKDSNILAHRTTFEVQLFYEAKSGSVFSEAALRDIRALETLLRNLDGWKRMCSMSDASASFRCEPGESLGNYAWPDREVAYNSVGKHTPFTLTFNGDNRERLPVHAFLTYLSRPPHDLRKFLPLQFGGPKEDAAVLRTLFSFTAPSLDDTAFRKAYEEFVSEELHPALLNATEAAEQIPDDPWIDPWSVRLYFRGSEIEAHEVRYYLAGDLEWAIGALFVTLIVTWFQLRSFFLAFVGMIQVCAVPLLAYVTVPIDELSLAGFMCIFIVVGLSSNDLLSIKEYWVRVGRECAKDYPKSSDGLGYRDDLNRYYSIRITRTFQAIFFRFLPQICAMCSWLVLLLSLIRPIREFGMFMFVGTAYACILCVAVFPPLLLIHEVYIQPFVHTRMHRLVANTLEPSSLRFPWRPAVRKCLLLATRPKAKRVWAITGAITMILFIITIVVAVTKGEAGLPEVFSPSHHSTAGRAFVDSFAPTSPALTTVAQETLVCELSQRDYSNTLIDYTNCGLHWCEAPLAAEDAAANTTQCTCHTDYMFLNAIATAHSYVNQTITLSGDAFSLLNDTSRMISIENYVEAQFPSAASKAFQGVSGRSLSSRVLEHWESGLTNVEPVVEMPSVMIKLDSNASAASSSNTHQMNTQCYCGPRICSQPTGLSIMSAKVQLPIPVVQPAGGRLLSEVAATASVSGGTEVAIVFGIEYKDKKGFLEQADNSWGFDTNFDATSPWAQRAMLKMCNNVPASFNVIGTECWIQDFKTWVVSLGPPNKFPTQRFGDFQALLKRFLQEQSHVPVSAMWMDTNGDMRATAFTFKVASKTKASDTLKDRQDWLQYVNAENEGSATSASSAWATSAAWAEAEAMEEAVSNAWAVAGLAIGITTLACIFYTWDGAFVCIVLSIAFIATNFLAFMMFCIFQWAVGPWEVILLITYIMYAIEPALRIGRATIWGGWMQKEMRLAGNAVTPLPTGLPALPPPGSTPFALSEGQLALGNFDTAGTADAADPDTRDEELINADAPARDNSSTNSPADQQELLQTAFEGRLHTFTLNVSNATFGSALKLVLCGIMALPCEFRLFVRLGAVTILIPLIVLPCIFILLPSAMVLLPIREKPDLVTFYEIIMAKVAAYRE
jgi:hypothetical protein